MLGPADLLRVMQKQGAVDNPPGIQMGTITSYNTCMLGDELQLEPGQLYFFERDTQRMARTVRPASEWTLEEPISEGMEVLKPKKEKKDSDRVVYSRPYKEGDTVALIEMPDGRYLVLGKVVSGEKVKKLDEQVNKDWSAPDFEEDTE